MPGPMEGPARTRLVALVVLLAVALPLGVVAVAGSGEGEESEGAALRVERSTELPATDAIFFAHGFRNDVGEATSLYTEFLKNFRTDLERPQFQQIAGRTYVVAGVYWPSTTFRESFGEAADGTRGLQNPALAMTVARLRS